MIDSLSPRAPELEFVPVNEALLSGVKVDGHVSSAGYHRLLVERLLPLSIKTALYLDSDIIINDDISGLLHLDVSGHVLAAVPDAWCDRNKIVRSKIQLREATHYFNTGVLLLNLERFRSERIGFRALKFCVSNSQSITFWDQCALNHIIQGNFLVLDGKWNFQVPHASGEASSAAVIHFTTGLKPWHYMCTHPMKNLYFKYLKHTAWHDFTETDRTPRNVVKRFLRTYSPSTASVVEASYMLGKRLLRGE